MDLADYDTAPAANEGRAMTVRLPNGEPITGDDGNPATITLLGADSEKVIAIRNAMIDKRMKTGRVVNSAADGDAQGIEFIARCTISWVGIKVDGKALECNFPNATALYKRFPWLREQADNFIGTRANFFKTPSTT